jgi:hypothetical protein
MRNKPGEGHENITNQYQAVQRIQDSDQSVPEVSRETTPTEEGNKTQLEDGTEPADTPNDPSSYFDEPDGEPITKDEIKLPCGHETITLENLPDRRIDVTCSVCDKKWGFEK